MWGPDSFDSRGSLWSSFDVTEDGPIGVLEACWLLHARRPLSQTEIIFPNELADPLDIEILEL